MADMSKVEMIVSMVAEKENVIEHTIMSDRRNASIVHARYVAFYLIYTLTNFSMPAIGRMFDKDHTTILHGIRRIEAERRSSPVFDSTIRHYHSILGHNHHLHNPDQNVKLPRKKITKIPIAPLESTN
jgi:chromosomal replication initiation ATPase DnaA